MTKLNKNSYNVNNPLPSLYVSHSAQQQRTPSPSERVAKGFTLAEVLITLVIIGVIAAITVPSLMNNTNKQEYVSKLKKAYSTLSQATNLIISNEGPVQGWVTNTDKIFDLYKKYLNNAKECSGSEGCIIQGAIKDLLGGSYNYETDLDARKLVLSDGTQIMFDRDIFPECDKRINGSDNVCTYMNVDLNGAKKPNTVGKDVFIFNLTKDGLHPAGCDYDACIGTKGYGCACKVLKEDAINY